VIGEFSKTGYVVIKDWLSDDEVNALLNDYKSSQTTNNKNYQITCASAAMLVMLEPKIQQILTHINQTTDLTVDLLTPGAMYTDTSWIDWGWHQDHESYYTLQQTKNYLNFYIILSKEDPTMSGLSIVPLNLLPRDDYNKIENTGATVYVPNGNITQVKSDDTGEEFTLSVNINTIAHTPVISAKDLLLIRGDVIHKTQDNSKQRTALSIRCTQGSAPISKDRLLEGCDVKRNMIKNNQQTYDSILQKFKTNLTVTAFDLYGNLD
jgi:hypothetical protein